MNNTTIIKTIYNEDYVKVMPLDGQKHEDYVTNLVDGQTKIYDGSPFELSLCKLSYAFPQMGEAELVSATTNIASEEGEKSSSNEATTTFVSDAVVAQTTPVAPASMPQLFLHSSDQINATSIKDFLGKPVLLYTGILQNTDNYGTFPRISMPSTMMAKDSMFYKLRGYAGLRATMVLRWVVNGTPFQQGRYMLAWIPCAGFPTNNVKANLWEEAHCNTLYERTQLPRIELDVNCDTEGTMRIPYSSALNYTSTSVTVYADRISDLGNIQIFPYFPITAAAVETAVTTIYGHFEDVELIGAAAPQMGEPTKKKSAQDREITSAGKNPISSTILAFSGATKVLSDVPIPVISDFAASVSWALGIAGNTAKALGFSKPMDPSPVCKSSLVNAPFIGNYDGMDISQSLAASSENQVAVVSGFAGTDVDEMSLNTIASIPAWFHTITWNPGFTSGYLLKSINLTPLTFLQNRTMSSIVVTNYTPVAFVTDFFTAWRGSFRFKFKLIKTAFHSGRLAFCFYPTASRFTPLAPTYANSDYVHREIVDIRQCNEFEITVPYVSDTPYIDTLYSFGTLEIFVVDDLKSPATVASLVSILCEVSAGSDFEWARPASNPNGLGILQGSVALGATPQMGEPCELVSTTIGSTSVVNDTSLNAQMAIGEKIVSFRSLLKMFKPQRVPTNQAPAAVQSYMPFAINASWWDSAVPSWTFPSLYGDLYDILGACYTMSRGGMRYKFLLDGTFEDNILAQCVDGAGVSGRTFGRGALDCDNNTPRKWSFLGRMALTYGKTQGTFEVSIPQYTLTHSRNNIAELANPAVGFHYSNVHMLGSGVMLNVMSGFGQEPTPATLYAPAYRAVADDFQFGGFVSTVPIIRYNPVPTYM